jgi:NADPH:quinone reductase-like Zn-dependent oxidoreductase
MVGLLAGARAEVDLGRLMARRVTLIGTVLRARSREEKADLVSSFSREVLPAFAERRLRPVLAETFAPSEVARAHRRLEAGAVFGKIAVVWEGAAPHAP